MLYNKLNIEVKIMLKDVNKYSPIGVFDSGIGGLTVLNKLIDMFPNEDFVYVGDTINLPYGTKLKETLKMYVSDVSNYLEKIPVKSIVIACNTATANSHHLKDYIDIPIIGVIEPTAKAALKISENILVLATNVTIESGEYKKVIDEYKKDKNSKQYYIKASEFVEAIEANDINTSHSFKLVREKLEQVKNEKIDVIILGCTHFALFANEISAVFPNTTLLECATPTGEELGRRLQELDLARNDNNQGKTIINVTKMQDNFYDKTKWFKHPYQGCYEIKIK